MIPFFDIFRGILLDYVHTILKGVFKKILHLLCDSSNHEQNFYLKPEIKRDINKKLSEIRPPDSIMRTPRTLDDLKFRKANEIEDFFLYYFPILLKDRLPKQYYNNILFIIYSIYHLSKTNVSDLEVDHAECLIELF